MNELRHHSVKGQQEVKWKEIKKNLQNGLLKVKV